MILLCKIIWVEDRTLTREKTYTWLLRSRPDQISGRPVQSRSSERAYGKGRADWQGGVAAKRAAL